jgi:hypothetical protein
MTTPYREAAKVPRFICIVCYKWMSTHPRACRDCHVEMNDLSQPDVRDAIRQEADKRLQSKMYREWSAMVLTSTVLVSPLVFVLSGYALLLSVPLSALLARGYVAVKKNSGIATYAARRRRISAELGVDIQLDEMHDTAGGRQRSGMQLSDHSVAHRADVDPLALEMEPLLAWLGAKLDGDGV